MAGSRVDLVVEDSGDPAQLGQGDRQGRVARFGAVVRLRDDQPGQAQLGGHLLPQVRVVGRAGSMGYLGCERGGDGVDVEFSTPVVDRHVSA